MKAKNKIKIIEEFIKAYQEMDSVYHNIYKVFMCSPESRFFECQSKMTDIAIKHISAIVGDKGGWLEWYVYENDCGKSKMEGGAPSNMKSIENVADLVYAMELPCARA